MSQVISSLSLIRGTILITTCHPAPEPTGVLVFRLLGWVTVGAAGHSLRASGLRSDRSDCLGIRALRLC